MHCTVLVEHCMAGAQLIKNMKLAKHFDFSPLCATFKCIKSLQHLFSSLAFFFPVVRFYFNLYGILAMVDEIQTFGFSLLYLMLNEIGIPSTIRRRVHVEKGHTIQQQKIGIYIHCQTGNFSDFSLFFFLFYSFSIHRNNSCIQCTRCVGFYCFHKEFVYVSKPPLLKLH